MTAGLHGTAKNDMGVGSTIETLMQAVRMYFDANNKTKINCALMF